jgi:hypothetical protein
MVPVPRNILLPPKFVPPTSNLPELRKRSPAPSVKSPVDVVTPDPTRNVPLFSTVDRNNIFPLDDPMEPVEDTAPPISKRPEVEVTVPPLKTVRVEEAAMVPLVEVTLPPLLTVMVEVARRMLSVILKAPELETELTLIVRPVALTLVAEGITMSSPTVGTWVQLQFPPLLKSLVLVLAKVQVAACVPGTWINK